MSKDTKTPMTPEAAARIQSHADRTGSNQDFKGRAQSSAAQNVNQGKVPSGGGKK